MKRREWLKFLAVAPLLARAAHAVSQPMMKTVKELQDNWKSFLPDGATVPAATEAVKLSDQEWSKRLSPQAYRVLRKESTERAGTSPLNEEKRAGIYACAGCDLPLFTSDMKFDSGTGWPSFFTTIPDAFDQKKDYFLLYPRIEYHCKRCGGHHGHVFDDGPQPTGERWCNNGVALKFLAKDAKG